LLAYWYITPDYIARMTYSSKEALFARTNFLRKEYESDLIEIKCLKRGDVLLASSKKKCGEAKRTSLCSKPLLLLK